MFCWLSCLACITALTSALGWLMPIREQSPFLASFRTDVQLNAGGIILPSWFWVILLILGCCRSDSELMTGRLLPPHRKPCSAAKSARTNWTRVYKRSQRIAACSSSHPLRTRPRRESASVLQLVKHQNHLSIKQAKTSMNFKAGNIKETCLSIW